MPNPYVAVLYPRATLGSILQEQASKNRQGISTYLMKLLLEHFKDKFIEKWNLEEYEDYHKTLTLTIIEQAKLKRQKEQEKSEKRKEGFDLRERKLRMQLERTKLKRELYDLEETLRMNETYFKDDTEQENKELRVKIKEIKAKKEEEKP